MTGSIHVDHWTSVTMYICSDIAGSPQGSPPEVSYVVVKPEGGPCSERENGTEERSSGIITLSARGPSDGLG
jgi:hypothetical protein